MKRARLIETVFLIRPPEGIQPLRLRLVSCVLAPQPRRTLHLKTVHRTVFFTALTLSGFESLI